MVRPDSFLVHATDRMATVTLCGKRPPDGPYTRDPGLVTCPGCLAVMNGNAPSKENTNDSE